MTLFFLVKWRYLIEWLKIVAKFYKHKNFCKTDLLLRSSYFFKSPFKVSKEFLILSGEEDVYTFGETPLTTFEKIISEIGVNREDRFFDLGCATGRTSLWLSAFVGCQVTGIEYIPHFVKKAKWASRIGNIPVDFRLENMLTTDFTEATIVYLYGTCFDDTFIHQLIQRLLILKEGTKVITVSYPLTDYCPKHFQLIKQFPARFTWGVADVFLQTRSCQSFGSCP